MEKLFHEKYVQNKAVGHFKVSYIFPEDYLCWVWVWKFLITDSKNGSFRHCVKDMIIYKNSVKSRFNNHMNNEHGVVILAYQSLSPAVYNWVY